MISPLGNTTISAAARTEAENSNEKRIVKPRRAILIESTSRSCKAEPSQDVRSVYVASSNVELVPPKNFAADIGIPAAKKLRKDELEKAIAAFLCTGHTEMLTKRSLHKSGVRDVERGLNLKPRIEHYTSNREIHHQSGSVDGAGATRILQWISLSLFMMVDTNVANAFREHHGGSYKKSTQPGYIAKRYVDCLQRAQDEILSYGSKSSCASNPLRPWRGSSTKLPESPAGPDERGRGPMPNAGDEAPAYAA